jgi:hypothetical protein
VIGHLGLAVHRRGLDVGEGQLVEAAHGAIAVQMADGEEQLILDGLGAAAVAVKLAVELEGEDGGLVGAVGLAFVALLILDLVRALRCFTGGEGE